jgi:hypothetical protein
VRFPGRHQLLQQRRGVIAHVDSVGTEAIPARAAHGGIDRRHARPIFRIQFRAPVSEELHQIVPAPC